LRRPDDPRLAEITEFWKGDARALQPRRAVLIGFPQDEGVRRNGGRIGAAEAPAAIRHWLYWLTPYDPAAGTDLAAVKPLDLGNVRVTADLERSQDDLATVVAAVLRFGAYPIIVGGGHETAFGHFLGYVAAGRKVAIVNIDAHLDVRPCLESGGHSGSPFRQALEHPTDPLARYICLGAQPHATAQEHARYVQERGGRIVWRDAASGELPARLEEACRWASEHQCQVYVSLDADVVRAADVPGVSAPNAAGLRGTNVLAAVRRAGASARVKSFDVVEINPRFDHDDRSARWAALAVWQFLAGLASRCR
jgi:formiminoglutamase